MKIAYFDCFSGIAGDMALAALLDCGVPLDELKIGLSSLPVAGWDVVAEEVLRSGIHAKGVSITEHGVSDEEELAHAHHHEHHHHHGRSMREIRDIIEASDLNARVKADSLAIFQKIAVAEAYLHHSTPDEVHFHEIGGLDSLLDIVGVAWCLDTLGIEAIYASALPLSSGWVDCAHGRMPVPAPATLEILKGAPWTPTDIRGELVTPTGAGILAALCKGFGSAPAMTIEKIGLGAGKKEFAERPNILRVSLGETTEASGLQGLETATLCLLETNIDDMNPQLFEAVFESLFNEGALDVWTTPIAMKKGRPAQNLSVLCPQNTRDAILRAILHETTTLGVRVSHVERLSLKREFESVQTRFGAVKIKIARWDEENLRRAHPEWEDVKRLARENGVTAREVFEAARAAF